MESAFFVRDFAICSRAERWFHQIQICAAMRPRIWCTNGYPSTNEQFRQMRMGQLPWADDRR